MATKRTKPKLWKSIVARVKAGSKGGRRGVWTARKAQLATARYKKAGGGYRGRKSSKNSLTKWSKQDWGYVSKRDAKKPRAKRGRYLPKKVRESLTKGQKAYTNRKKREATKKGKTRASYTKRVAKKVRRA
mgnify:FL=1|tara:strand:- start:9542 stop:9934 length:393 start_codon:yes stop_codon:yes gene_type:complete